MPDSMQPHRWQPTRLLCPWDSLGKNTGVDCQFLLQCMHAKSLQSCPTLCNPIDGSPPGSPVLGILQERILEWVAISFSNAWKWKVKVKSLSCVRLCDPMDCSLPGSSVCGIFQARVLEWGSIAFSAHDGTTCFKANLICLLCVRCWAKPFTSMILIWSSKTTWNDSSYFINEEGQRLKDIPRSYR